MSNSILIIYKHKLSNMTQQIFNRSIIKMNSLTIHLPQTRSFSLVDLNANETIFFSSSLGQGNHLSDGGT